MADLAVGQEIGIVCRAQPGPFADERLVTVEGIDGSVSGFVKRDRIEYSGSGQASVRATVRSAGPSVVEAWIEGAAADGASFFTTNGLVRVRPEAIAAV